MRPKCRKFHPLTQRDQKQATYKAEIVAAEIAKYFNIFHHLVLKYALVQQALILTCLNDFLRHVCN